MAPNEPTEQQCLNSAELALSARVCVCVCVVCVRVHFSFIWRFVLQVFVAHFDALMTVLEAQPQPE